VAHIFIDKLEQEVKDIYEEFKVPNKMIFKQKHKTIFENSTKCHICGGELGTVMIKLETCTVTLQENFDGRLIMNVT